MYIPLPKRSWTLKSIFDKDDVKKAYDAIEMKNIANKLCEKWNKTGLLKGLQGRSTTNMVRILESQASELLRDTQCNKYIPFFTMIVGPGHDNPDSE